MTRGLESPLVRAYREMLGVSPGAGGDDLKKAYHRLALIYHPDRNPDPASALDFQKVRAAYETLLDQQKVATLNANHRRERMLEVVVEGLNITVGSFFGHRHYKAPGRAPRALRIGSERAHESDVDRSVPAVSERDVSILDDPAFDAIEVVYAGKFSVGDEERLRSGLASAHLRQLPWVVLNNQGILHILDRKFELALRCFTELDERVPNNIVFTYRRGLCHVVIGLQARRRGRLGRETFDRAEVKKGLKFLERAVALGSERSIGKQKCLVIRKLIADVLAHLGRGRAARRAWGAIHDLQPLSREASARTGRPRRVTGRR